MEGSRKNGTLRSRSRSRRSQKNDKTFDDAEDEQSQIAEFLTLSERSTQKIGNNYNRHKNIILQC
jgi:hypothetical protein